MTVILLDKKNWETSNKNWCFFKKNYWYPFPIWIQGFISFTVRSWGKMSLWLERLKVGVVEFLNTSASELGIPYFLLLGEVGFLKKTISQKNFLLSKTQIYMYQDFLECNEISWKNGMLLDDATSFRWIEKSMENFQRRKLLQWLRSKKDNDSLEDDFLMNIIKSILFFPSSTRHVFASICPSQEPTINKVFH